MLRVILFLFLLEVTSKVKAQSEPSPFALTLSDLLVNERLVQNATLRSGDGRLQWSALRSDISWHEADMTVRFDKDSVHWNFKSPTGEASVSFPNDITLLMGHDRDMLQKLLVKQLESHEATAGKRTLAATPDSVAWQSTGDRYAVLTQLRLLDLNDSSLVCHPKWELGSLVNAITDPSACDGLYPMRLVMHRYGFARDTVNTDIPALLSATGAADWPKWAAIEDDEAVVMFSHPFLGFEHMLALRPSDIAGQRYWMADMYAFIPSHNVLDLFKKYEQKEGAERFRIK
jgi:hypothetical protein